MGQPEGWRHLTQSAAGALTRFRPGEQPGLPAKGEVDDDFYLPRRGWSMLGGDVFEGEQRLVVRLQLPGMEKQDISIEVLDDALVVSGEKRFQREKQRRALARHAECIWQLPPRCSAAGRGQGALSPGRLPQWRAAGGTAQGRAGQS